MKNKLARLCVISFSGLFFGSQICGQDAAVKKCKSEVKGGSYKRSEIAPSHRQPHRFSGNVLVSRKHVNRAFLIQLSKRLRSEYCTAIYLKVAIYDDANKMDFGWEVYNKSIDPVRARGSYTFDKLANTELIEFLEKSGDRATKIQIDLAKTRYKRFHN